VLARYLPRDCLSHREMIEEMQTAGLTPGALGAEGCRSHPRGPKPARKSQRTKRQIRARESTRGYILMKIQQNSTPIDSKPTFCSFIETFKLAIFGEAKERPERGREEKARQQEVKQEEQEYIGEAATSVRGTGVASSNFSVSCIWCLTR
jgi:hypothetical protein